MSTKNGKEGAFGKRDAAKSRGYSPKKKPTLDDLMEGFQVVGPEPESVEAEESVKTAEEQYEEAKEGIERILEGGESVPEDIYGGTRSSGVYCDVHVDDQNVQKVRLHLAEVYGALLAVDSAKALKIFRDCYVDGLYGAGSKLPYAEKMLKALEAIYAA